MENIELEDLVYAYPDYDIPNFQTLTSAKEEFREVGALVQEPPPKRGQLFRHQQFFKRFMLQYDNQLVISETGSGKTCQVFSVTEHFKILAASLEEFRKSTPVPYKRVYVLVKGQSLVDELKFQLVCKCTDGDYITPQILNSKTESQRKSNVTRSISKYYTITTYGIFAKEVFGLNEQQMKNRFDNCIFIVDEVHNINDDKSGGLLRTDPVTNNQYYVKSKKNKKTGEYEEKIIESRLIYDQLWRLFHHVSPRKVMLLSATPMINEASEIGPRLNLILPADHQIPDDTDYNTVTLEELEPYFRGLISYVRALDTGAIPMYQGKVISGEYEIGNRTVEAQMVVYPTQMSEKQTEVYEIAMNDPLSLKPESTKPGAFDDLQRQAANFIFPDDSTGSDGYKRYVVEDKNTFLAKPDLQDWISSPERLRQLSSKYYEVIRLCKNEPGNCWCYSEFIRGSGAIVLGLCFEAQGFSRFTEVNSVFSTSGKGGLAPLCGGKTLEGEKERYVRISKGLRYALLTSETTSPESAALLELFNSYENRHGEYIKAIIGSPVTRDGLNLANVLQIHLLGPGWNQASSYQAESRAIRSTSHVDLIEEEKEKLLLEGKDPSTANVIIKIYRHAAITSEGTSIDLRMYQLSEKKDYEIKRIMRMMKQSAVDCQINYRRNVRPNDIDYSATCDYDICSYSCVNPAPLEIDYTSYDVLYSGDIIEAIILDISDLFRVVFTISFDDLYNELSGYKRKFVDLAVSSVIENKKTLIDRYGYVNYLREDRGTLFLSQDFPLNLQEKVGSIAISEYSSNLLGIISKTLNEYIGTTQRKDENILNIFDDISPEEYDETIENLTLENRVLLLETAIYYYYISKIDTETIRYIIHKFKNYVFITYDPVKALEISREALENRGKGRGRKPKAETKFKLTSEQEKKAEKFISPKKGDIIYFHNLSSSTQSLTSYAVTAKGRKTKEKIRILKPNEKVGWRDANDYEEPIYNLFIRHKMEKEREKIGFDIYGTILEDGNFRIIDKTTEDAASKTDTRRVNRGKICFNGWKKPDLLKLMWKIGFNPFRIEIDANRDALIEFVVLQRLAKREEAENFPDEKLAFYYAWGSSGANVIRICEMLQAHFEDTGRLIQG